MNIQNITSVEYKAAGTTSWTRIPGVQYFQWWVRWVTESANEDQPGHPRITRDARVWGSLYTEDPDIAETLASLHEAGVQGDSQLKVSYMHKGAAKVKVFTRVIFCPNAGAQHTTKRDPAGNDLLNRITYCCSINSKQGEKVSDVVKNQEPAAVPPTVSSTSVVSIGPTTATGNGDVTYANGAEVTERGFCWSVMKGPTTDDCKAAASASGVGTFNVAITGLKPNTIYYARAYALNSTGVSYGREIQFTTTITTPAVTTLAATRIAKTSASTGGCVTSNGGSRVTARGVCWALTQNPTINDNVTRNAGGDGYFYSKLVDLQPGLTYYIRAYAANEAGISYGQQETFNTTNLGVPTVVTYAVPVRVTDSTGQAGGQVTADGGSPVKSRGICWNTTGDPNPTTDPRTVNGSGLGIFVGTMTGLSLGTTYYIRAWAVNAVGIAYGEQVTLTMTAEGPSVSTLLVSGITMTSAICGGIVTNEKGSPVTARGVVWDTNPNPTVALATKTSDGAGLGEYLSSVTGLSSKTTYYLRAYAVNAQGTGYGGTRVFTTT